MNDQLAIENARHCSDTLSPQILLIFAQYKSTNE